MANKFKFKLNYASPCNYKYTQARGGEVGTISFTDEQLTRYAGYIKNVLAKQTEKRDSIITVHGAPAFEIASQLDTFSGAVGDAVDGLFVDVALKDVADNISTILTLVDGGAYGSNVRFTCSTSLVDMTDNERYALRYMLLKGLCTYVTVALTPSNIGRIVEIFNSFKTFRDIYGNTRCELHIDEAAMDSEDFDEAAIRSALETIANVVDADETGQLAIDFVYRPALALRGVRTGDALMGDVMCEMTELGVIYPGYDVRLLTDRGRDELAVGNAEDDFEDIDAGRKYLFDQLDESGNGLTGTCEDMTRAVPWDDPNHIYSMVPSAQLCKMHELLAEYLPYRLKQHNDDKFGTQ